MDTNAPDEDHWWPVMSGEVPVPDWLTAEEVSQLVKPDDWEFFSQPGAMTPVKNKEGRVARYEMNPARENAQALPDSYYQRKTHGWISVYVCNEYGSLSDGKPVYPTFDKGLHVARERLSPVSGHTVFVGLDFGLTPAAVFGQRVHGRWRILKEIVARDMGTKRFSQLVKQTMGEMEGEFAVYGDPAGDSRAQTDENTPFRILATAGIKARPTTTNDPVIRIEAVTQVLERLVDKLPGLIIDPSCRNLIKGFEDGYNYKRLQVSGEHYSEAPDKNRFSHVHDSLQYSVRSSSIRSRREARSASRGTSPKYHVEPLRPLRDLSRDTPTRKRRACASIQAAANGHPVAHSLPPHRKGWRRHSRWRRSPAYPAFVA